jgi:hypothetical protein
MQSCGLLGCGLLGCGLLTGTPSGSEGWVEGCGEGGGDWHWKVEEKRASGEVGGEERLSSCLRLSERPWRSLRLIFGDVTPPRLR